MKEYELYYQGKVLDYKYSNSIAKSIYELGLKKGDIFKLHPFNYFGDEKTEYKEDEQIFHGTLSIEKIDVVFIETWNSIIKSKIKIYILK